MTSSPAGDRLPGTSPTYFFLSYAHTAPLADEPAASTDYWVDKLFYDLSDAVREAAGAPGAAAVGFFDGTLPAGADWKAHTTRELGRAEVFVPLLSQGYFAMSWPGREWTCFSSRLEGRPEGGRHILPVLWAPLSRSRQLPVAADPLWCGRAVPEYAENGLRALSMLTLYRDGYESVVRELGAQIVRVARDLPLGPSAVRPLYEEPSAFHHGHGNDDFVVAVAAPTAQTVPAGRAARCYGAASTDWRPFGSREELRLADLAVTAAERLDFSTAVRTVGRAVRSYAATPGVVLIDPWIADSPAGDGDLRALRELFSGERRHWTLPLAVLDLKDPQSQQRRDALLGQLGRVLGDIGALTTETARRGARGVFSVEEFAAVMPVLVAEAERQYLKHSGQFPQSGAAVRPRRGGAQAGPSRETGVGSDE
jgi:FxsC-like protein